MKVLVACEESQRVCIEFRKRGHIAFSCDIKKSTGGHPEWHIQEDVTRILSAYRFMPPDSFDWYYGVNFLTESGRYCEIHGGWDLIIAFPPCTYFSRMNFLNYYRNGKFNFKRFEKAKEYINLFNAIYNARCNKICIENPVPMKLFDGLLPKYSMTFQPYEFGANYSKKTCLWLKGLPPLIPTCQARKQKPLITVDNSFELYKDVAAQSTFRSKTFIGVAEAMAEQWGGNNYGN